MDEGGERGSKGEAEAKAEAQDEAGTRTAVKRRATVEAMAMASGGAARWVGGLWSTSMCLPKRLELSLKGVRALPNASKTGVEWRMREAMPDEPEVPPARHER